MRLSGERETLTVSSFVQQSRPQGLLRQPIGNIMVGCSVVDRPDHARSEADHFAQARTDGAAEPSGVANDRGL